MNPCIQRSSRYIGAFVAVLGTGGVAVIMAVLCTGCGGGPADDDARILAEVERLRNLAEKRDLNAIMEMIDEDYEDFQGRGRDRARTFIEDHFRRYRGIVIHLLKTEIDGETGMDERLVEADVLLSSGAAEALRRTVRFYGETYRIDLVFVRSPEGDWLVSGASWCPVAPDDLLPGSREALEKLFPEAFR